MLTRMVSISWPCDPPASASQRAGITGMSHWAWPDSHSYGSLCLECNRVWEVNQWMKSVSEGLFPLDHILRKVLPCHLGLHFCCDDQIINMEPLSPSDKLLAFNLPDMIFIVSSSLAGCTLSSPVLSLGLLLQYRPYLSSLSSNSFLLYKG